MVGISSYKNSSKPSDLITYLLCLICAFLGFLTTFSILINREFRASGFINSYLIIVFTISSSRFFLYGIQTYLTNPTIKFFVLNLGETSYVFIVPLLFLYFQNLLYETKWERKMLVHIIIPVIIVLLNYTRFLLNDVYIVSLFKMSIFILFIPYALTYVFVTLRIFRKQIKESKSNIEAINKQNSILKKWSIVLISFFIVMALKAVAFVLFQGLNYDIKSNDTILWTGSIHWIIVYATFLLNPDIMYGYNALNKKINTQITHRFVLNDIWILTPEIESFTNIKDQKLSEKITQELENYLLKIEFEAFQSDFFRTPGLTIDDLSNKIFIPASHLSYIFKYHSSVSFTEFKKIIRIQDSIKLLKSGFLKNNTTEALALKVGFSSYTPFFNSFKRITNMAPLEFFKSI